MLFELEILTQLAVECRHDDIRSTRILAQKRDKLSGFQFFSPFFVASSDEMLYIASLSNMKATTIMFSPSFHPRGSEGLFCALSNGIPVGTALQDELIPHIPHASYASAYPRSSRIA